MTHDELTAFREADPLRRVRLDAVDPGALDVLRRGIMMTDPTERPAQARARKPHRRLLWGGAIGAGVVAVVATAATVGGVPELFMGGLADGPNCLTTWGEDAEAYGPWLTGDAIADCHTIRAEAGLPPIEDPVTFAVYGFTYVVPRSEVPPVVKILGSSRVITPQDLELEASLGDWVDGGASEDCRPMDEMVAWVESDLARLGLTDWKVTTRAPEPDAIECTFAFVAERGEVMVVHERLAEDLPAGIPSPTPTDGMPSPTPTDGAAPSGEPSVIASDEPEPSGEPTPVASGEPLPSGAAAPPVEDEAPASDLRAIAAALRTGIAERCVTLAEARSVADEALAGLEYEPFPTTSIHDESAGCARVDMRVGGNLQVTVYGPTALG